jgi:Alr-MurF fusion protein
MITSPPRPTYALIDLGAIQSNLEQMRRICSTDVMAVVKANAYGHGAEPVARAAAETGTRWYGVAFVGEGVELRKAGLQGDILVLGYTPPELAGEAIANELSITVFDLELAEAYARTGTQMRSKARLHVKVETGMGRLGLLPDRAVDLVRRISRMKGVDVEGMFTHFANADEADLSFTYEQLNLFRSLVETLESEGLRPPLVHAANSAAGLRIPEARLDLVRMGIAMYGLHPSQDAPLPFGFRPALAWKTTVSQVRWVQPEVSISYGRTYFTKRQEQIAVLPVGYADGFRRSPPVASQVLLHGQRVPVVGRVCMDQAMINATQLENVRVGDEVVLIGGQGEASINAEEVAGWWATINYEVTSGIMARVPRIYL